MCPSFRTERLKQKGRPDGQVDDREPHAAESCRHAASIGARRANILVVDDDVSMRELLELHLSNAGYSVALADDAIAAGRMFLGSTPDLLLIDVSMPYMSGLDFVATVFADVTVPIIPVV